MKRFITALAICALLLAPATVLALHTWDGDASSVWRLNTNWDQANWPGQGGGGDSHDALIDKSQTPGGFPELASDETIATLTMRDGTSDANDAVTLTIDDSYTLYVTGTFNVPEGTVDNGSYVEKKGAGTILANTFEMVGGTYGVTVVVSAGKIETYTP